MGDGRGFWSVCLFLSVLVGFVGTLFCGVERLFFFLPPLYFWVTIWVFLFVFSVGHEWSMLRLGGSGVLSQGAGYGIVGVCFLFPR